LETGNFLTGLIVLSILSANTDELKAIRENMLKYVTAVMILLFFYGTSYGEKIYIPHGEIYIDIPSNFVKLSENDINKYAIDKDSIFIAAYKNDTGSIFISFRVNTLEGVPSIDSNSQEVMDIIKRSYKEPISNITATVIKNRRWIKLKSKNDKLGLTNTAYISNIDDKFILITFSLSNSVYSIYSKDLLKLANSISIKNKNRKKPVKYSLLSTSLK